MMRNLLVEERDDPLLDFSMKVIAITAASVGGSRDCRAEVKRGRTGRLLAVLLRSTD